jgi:pyruvate kinase
MRRSRKVKILATLGPASSEKAVIQRLFEAGADIFRINMSHTDHPKLRSLVATIREVEAEVGRPIGILADLQGPKLRLGTFVEGFIDIRPGDVFVLDSLATTRVPTSGSNCPIPRCLPRSSRDIACCSTTAR